MRLARYIVVPENMPMGDELKRLLKDGSGHIFKRNDISVENVPTLHTISLAPAQGKYDDEGEYSMLSKCR